MEVPWIAMAITTMISPTVTADLVGACEAFVNDIRLVSAKDVPAIGVSLGGIDKPGVLGRFWTAAAASRAWAGAVYRVEVTRAGLLREPAAVAETLVHEATHALARQRSIQDTSRQGRWHNSKFRALALELGLDPGYCAKRGYGVVGVLTDGRYAASIARLGEAFGAAGVKWVPAVETIKVPKVRVVLVGRCKCEAREWPIRLPAGPTGLRCRVCCADVVMGE